MPRHRNPAPSLPLFEDGGLTRDRALQMVARCPLGSGLRKVKTKCAGACCKHEPTHGPYWHARTPVVDGKGGKSVYVGSDEAKARLEAAWELVRAELAEAEAKAEAASQAVPEIREYRALQAVAGVRTSRAYAGLIDRVRLVAVGGETRPPK